MEYKLLSMKIFFWNVSRNKSAWCRFFHTCYMGINGMWKCPTCGCEHKPRISDNDTGPM